MSSLVPASQDSLFQQAIDAYGADIARFVAGYEAQPAKRQELLQEVHLSLWQSFAGFRGQCSLRTWVYRIAHNVGVTHVQRSVRAFERHAIDLDAAQTCADEAADIAFTDRRLDFERVLAMIHALAPLDRQVMLMYLEDIDAATIAEVTGISARNVATKIHRLKALLAQRLNHRSTFS